MNILVRWLVSALALLFVSYIVPGFQVESFYAVLIASLVLGLVNVLIRPILLLLTLPINVLTLGIFTFVINALMLWLTASIVKGFTINSFEVAVAGAVVLWLINMAIDFLCKSPVKIKE